MKIKLENIYKKYRVNAFNEKVIFYGYNLVLSSDKINFLVGKSGRGKTTLLNIIGLVEKMDSGRYEYNGASLKPRNQKEISKFRNQKIGYIHQESMLIGELNVLENIMIPLYIKGRISEEAYHRAYDLMEKLNIYDLKGVKAKKLSGGEKQRVEAVRALVTQPEIVLADEPTGSLDKENGREIIKLLRDINKKDGTLILIATHDEKLITEKDTVIRITETAY